MSKKNSKKRTFPGSIFLRGNRIYIKFKGKQESTQLRDTPEGWKIAEQRLRDKYHEMMMNSSSLIAAKPTTIAIHEAFQLFIAEHCSNKTKKTQRSYADAFHKIVTNNYYVNAERIRKDVVAFVTESPSAGLSDTSINLHLRSFQVFLTYCYKRGYTASLLEVKEFKKKVEPKDVKTFTDDEVAQLVEYFTHKDTEFALFLRFLCTTGWRVGEVLSLEWKDVAETTLARIPKDKSRKDIFPMTQAVKEILDALPRTIPGKVFRWQATSQSRLLRRLNEAMKDLGIEKKGRGWHTFRKTATNRWLASGLPMQDVQSLLGHRDITTTRRHYVKPEIEKIGNKLDALSL